MVGCGQKEYKSQDTGYTYTDYVSVDHDTQDMEFTSVIIYSNNKLSLRLRGITPWFISTYVSEADDTKVILGDKHAEIAINGWYKQKYLPSMVVRCKEKRLEIYIVVDMYPDVEYGHDGSTVRVRFDKTKAFRQRWSKSTDGKALFSPYPKSFFRQMRKHKTLWFQFTPYNSSSISTYFNVGEGINRLSKAISRGCRI